MPDLIAIGQGLSAVKAATEIVKTMLGLRDAAKLQENSVKLNSEILSVQSALAEAQKEQTALLDQIRELEKEVARLKAWEGEKQKYKLNDVGHGAFAYVRKATAEPSEAPHWLCTNCYTNSEKSILSRSENTVGLRGDERRWSCPRCRAGILVHWSASPSKQPGAAS